MTENYAVKDREMDYRKERIQNLSDDEIHRDEILRRRLINPDEKKRFRKAFALKAGMDYSTLKPYCEDVVMAVDGFADHIDIVRAKLELALREYDSDKDVLVVVGRSFDNLLVGTIVAQKVLTKQKSRQSYAIAVYYGFSYKFYEVFLDPTIEAHEIYMK
jgi:hypothetical protein